MTLTRPPIHTNAVVTPVLGMRHSGSSQWTRALSMLGMELGQTHDSPEVYGSKRFWENEFFLALNGKILRSMDRDFDGYGDYATLAEIPEIALGISLSPEDEDFVRQHIAQAFPCSHWGWMDPSSMLLFPFWLNLLTALGFRDIRPLLVIRHPLPCARALLREREILNLANQMQRDPTALVLEIWLVYHQLVLAILDQTECFISIHRWLADGDHARSELERAERYLELSSHPGGLQEALTWLDPASVPADEDGEAAFVDAESLALYWNLVSRAEQQRAG